MQAGGETAPPFARPADASGVTVQVSEAQAGDAAAVIALLTRLYAETGYLLYEPGEQALDADSFAARIDAAHEATSGIMYLARADEEVVGVVFGNRGPARRSRHSLSLVMGVLETWWGRGAGQSLLRAVEGWAATHGAHRLELTVQKQNARAVDLYTKAGFEVEGTKRHALVVHGEYIDECVMAKLLGTQEVAVAGHPAPTPSAGD